MPRPPKPPTFPLLAALDAATPQDLEEVDRRMKTLDEELERLRVVRRLLAAKFEPPKERKKSGPRKKEKEAADRAPAPTVPPAASGSTHQHRLRAAKYLHDAGGPRRQAVVAEECDIPAGSISTVMTHPWFDKDARTGMVALSAQGRTEAVS